MGVDPAVAFKKEQVVVPLETEARFWVQEFNCSCMVGHKSSVRIVQHYIPLADGGYARIRNQNDCDVLTVKRGWGMVREEPSMKFLRNETGAWLTENMPVQTLVKERYRFDGGWTLDVYLDPEADGLVILEYEGPNPEDAHRNLPMWAKKVRDVTSRVDNATVAQWIWEKRSGISEWSAVERMRHVPRFSLDGGPGCGKTTLIDLIRKMERFADRMVIVPEAARLMVEYGLVNIPLESPAGMASFEGAIFAMHELLYKQAENHARRVGAVAILEDRHPIHPLCYLNNQRELFELAAGTTVARQMAVGDLVIYLELPPREIYERMAETDPVRYESYDQALARDKIYKEVYQGFGDRLVVVPFEENFERKVEAVLGHIDHFLASREN